MHLNLPGSFGLYFTFFSFLYLFKSHNSPFLFSPFHSFCFCFCFSSHCVWSLPCNKIFGRIEFQQQGMHYIVTLGGTTLAVTVLPAPCQKKQPLKHKFCSTFELCPNQDTKTKASKNLGTHPLLLCICRSLELHWSSSVCDVVQVVCLGLSMCETESVCCSFLTHSASWLVVNI